jgi:7-cyano-7-deazaguanine synthase in queuosine biosynthesis
MDSATCLYEARAAGFDLYALTVNYGQRAKREIQAAQKKSPEISWCHPA